MLRSLRLYKRQTIGVPVGFCGVESFLASAENHNRVKTPMRYRFTSMANS